MRVMTVAILVFVAKVLNALLYAGIIVPKLADVRWVPIHWWFGTALPLVGVVVWAGIHVRSWRKLFVYSAVAGLTAHLFDFGAALLHVPATAKSWAHEAPVLFWTAGPVMQCLAWAMVIGAVWGCAEAARSRGAFA
jgi:hypothetical protein